LGSQFCEIELSHPQWCESFTNPSFQLLFLRSGFFS
jgi:hypothetical protein